MMHRRDEGEYEMQDSENDTKNIARTTTTSNRMKENIDRLC